MFAPDRHVLAAQVYQHEHLPVVAIIETGQGEGLSRSGDSEEPVLRPDINVVVVAIA
jgi:hypothetical protein